VKPVDQRSAIRKADAVLPAFARAGQRHDTLKRVAQRGRCRLLFLFGVKHVCVGCGQCAALVPGSLAGRMRACTTKTTETLRLHTRML
jgi:hypothetical protein